MNAESVLNYLRTEALDHKRRKEKKLNDQYYDFIDSGFKHRRKSISHLRPRR